MQMTQYYTHVMVKVHMKHMDDNDKIVEDCTLWLYAPKNTVLEIYLQEYFSDFFDIYIRQGYTCSYIILGTEGIYPKKSEET